MKQTLKYFTYGLLLTALAAALSFALAFWGFERAYYLAPILPSFMTLYLLLAWLIYLRGQGQPRTMAVDRRDRAAEPALPKESGEIPGSTVQKDEYGLVTRRPERYPGGQSSDEAKEETRRRESIYILLCSAFQLGLLATILYAFFGVGAKYY